MPILSRHIQLLLIFFNLIRVYNYVHTTTGKLDGYYVCEPWFYMTSGTNRTPVSLFLVWELIGGVEAKVHCVTSHYVGLHDIPTMVRDLLEGTHCQNLPNM